jgi:MFS transporter, ACS family, glucarate transporter
VGTPHTGANLARGRAVPRVATGSVRWALAGGLLLPVTFVMSLDRTAMTVAAPAIQDAQGFSLNQMSVILTAFAWAYALFQVPGGLLAERFGPRKMLAFAGAWWSVFTFLTPYGSVFLGFVLVRIMLGIGQAADWPTSVMTLQRWFPARERSRGNSLLLAGLYLGPFVGTPIVAWIVDRSGWEQPFHIFAVFGLALAVLWYVFVRDEPAAHPRISRAEVEHIRSGREHETDAPKLPWRAFLSSGQFWAVGMQYAFLLLIQGFFVTWLPTYLVQAKGFSLTGMGIAGSLPWAAMIVAVFGTGAIVDRRRMTWRSRTWLAIAGYVIGAVTLTVGALVHGQVATVAWLCVSLGAVGMVQVQVWGACQDLGGRYSATVTGWTNTWGNLTGAAGPLFTGLLVGIGASWGIALAVLSVAALLGAICWLFVHADRPLTASGPSATVTS